MTDYISVAMKNLRDAMRHATTGVLDPVITKRNSASPWIQLGAWYPNYTEITPQIFISIDREKPGEEFLGGGPRSYYIRTFVEIRLREGISGTVDSVSYNNSELLQRLIDKVSNWMETNKKSVTGIQYITRITAGACKWDSRTKSWYAKAMYELYIHRAS